MQIDNLASYPAGSRFEVDVVIVGGGPAGLTVAREFMNSAATILILESGLETESAAHMEFNRLESGGEPKGEASINFRKIFHGNNMPPFDHDLQPYGVRCRVLGGSAAYWGGKSATFDETDFARRDWVPNSGWPISRDSLKPYFERAANILNLGPNLYDEEMWALIGAKVKRPALDSTKLRSFFWQFSRSRLIAESVMNFADEFRVLNSDNILTLVNATVLHITTNPAGDTFSELAISTIEGGQSCVKAKVCVLAAGGVENARLLLNSNRQHKTGLGNTYDNVGRYLMDHPGTRIGYFKKEDLKAAGYLGFYAIPHKKEYIMYMHGLVFSPDFQARNKLLNTAIYVLPEISPKDPIGAAKRLLKFNSANFVADLWLAASGFGLLAKGIGLKLFYSGIFPNSFKNLVINFLMSINPTYVIREFQSKRVPHQLDRMGIHVITEQQPDRESRLVLSQQKDPLGSPQVIALWKISEAERRSVIAIGQLLLEELPKAGMPAPVLDPWIVENRLNEGVLVDMAHIIGTTRMSDDPKTGVVDAQGKVHGVNGLYIVGSSVFPTSSHVNPTLMIVSLAIRTADQIKMILSPIMGRSLQ